MRVKYFLIIIALSPMMLWSCSKENVVDPDVSDTAYDDNSSCYRELILGSWDADLNRSYESYTESGETDIQYFCDWASGLNVTCEKYGRLKYSAIVFGVVDEWYDSYSVHGDTLVWDVRAYEIQKLDSNQLVVESTLSDTRTTAGGTSFVTTVTKHYEFRRAE